MSRRGLFCCGSRLVKGRLEDEEEPSCENAPQIFLAEVLGTGALVLLGDAVVAGVLLSRSKAQNSGWIVITLAWGLAVFTGVLIAGPFSGAHLNPAVTLAFALSGSIGWDLAVVYWAAELLGAFIGAVLVFLHYFPHWAETEDADLKLAVYSTGPAIRNTRGTSWSEFLGTFVLVFVIFIIVGPPATTRPRRARPTAGGAPGRGHRPVAWRHHRLRDQPRPRPRPAHRALPAPDPRQARLRLGVLVDPGRRAAARRRRRLARLQLRCRQLPDGEDQLVPTVRLGAPQPPNGEQR